MSLFLLFLCWHQTSPKQAFLLGWLYGMAMFSCGVYWFFISMHYYGYVTVVLSILLCFLFFAFMSLYPATLGYISRRFQCPSLIQYGLFLPMLWTVFEWLRSVLFTGFPWLLLGTSQLDTLIAGIIPMGGVFLASFMVALISGLLFLSCLNKSAYPLLFTVFLLLLLLPWHHFPWTQDKAPVRVSLIQGNIKQDEKWLPSHWIPTLKTYISLTASVWDTSDIIIWPESAIPDFYHNAKSELIDYLQEATEVRQTTLLTGILYEDDAHNYYNALLLIGKPNQFYFKQHLVPFTEYLPSVPLLRPLVNFMQVPVSGFSAAKDKPVLTTKNGLTIGSSICFEDTFGNEMRQLPETDILVNVSNDAWFNDSIALPQHLQSARLRALEFGRYLLRTTNTGITAIINPYGEIVQQLDIEQQGVLSGLIQSRQGKTPFYRYGNLPLSLLILVIILFITFHKQRNKISHPRH